MVAVAVVALIVHHDAVVAGSVLDHWRLLRLDNYLARNFVVPLVVVAVVAATSIGHDDDEHCYS